MSNYKSSRTSCDESHDYNEMSLSRLSLYKHKRAENVVEEEVREHDVYDDVGVM